MNKYFLIGIVFLFFISFTFAVDDCVINETCSWYVYGVESETGVNISFTYPNGSNTENYSMVNIGVGKYSYNVSFGFVGNVLGCAYPFNNSGLIYSNCESKAITNTTITEEEVFDLASALDFIYLGKIILVVIFLLFVIYLFSNKEKTYKHEK